MDEMQRKYANFLITRALRAKKGCPLAICYFSSQKEFVKIVEEEALKYGMSEVYLLESNEKETRSILESSSVEEIENNPYFDRSKIKEAYDKGGCLLWPDSLEKWNLKGIEEEKIKAMNNTKIKTQKDSIAARRRYEFSSCIAAVATKSWAEEVFPSDPNAYEKLWNMIFKITMMDKEDPIKAWDEQIKRNTKRKDLLNELRLSKLILQNKLGTNLEVGFIKDVIWQGTSKISIDGAKDGIVNMPTYENFTSPNKNDVNGTIVSSAPLFLRGNKIEGIKLNFKDGRLTKASAKTNEETLLKVIKEYEGMNYIGECALVDDNSPINNTKIDYMTTLIEENKGIHIAIGNSFIRTIPNGTNMTPEELEQVGFNSCPNHVDIVIGTSDMKVTGIDVYGNKVPIFIDGNFAEEKVKEFIKNRKE